MEKVGVVGLGRMGSAAALRLFQQGVEVRGWTRSGKTLNDVQTMPDLGSLVDASDTLILSLFDNEAVAEVLQKLLEFDLDGKLIVETSTVIPGILRDRIGAIEDAGACAVDAPIAGGPDLVVAGKCGFFIGGDEASAERAGVVLGAITERVLHVGPLGAGLIMKAINNSMIQAYLAALYDLMPLAKRGGLSLEAALRILSGGPASMPLIANRIPKIVGTDPEVDFALSAAFKDNEVIQQIMESFDLSSPVLANFGSLKQVVADADMLEEDPASLIRIAYERG